MGGLGGQKKMVLGRGLSALFEPEVSKNVVPIQNKALHQNGPVLQIIPITLIAPGPSQPRKEFNEVTLVELSQSILRNGLIQPIVVQKVSPEVHSGSSEIIEYKILAGERRWRACCYLGWTEIPAIVQETSSVEALTLSLIENIQREDINPLEEAQAYKRLLTEGGHTQESLASQVGKSRSHVANILRLNSLPDSIKKLMQTHQLSVGHARALINIENSEEVALQVLKKGLTVRQTEQLINSIKYKKNRNTLADPEKKDGNPRRKLSLKESDFSTKSEDILSLEQDIENLLGYKVDIQLSVDTKEGVLSFRFNGLEDLDTLLGKITPVL